jgi:alpha-tubulin suppressor-like RCC1 family protein
LPIRVQGIENAKSVAVGTFHQCALLTDGTVRCWGSNSDGQVGDGTGGLDPEAWIRNKPVAAVGLSNVVSISAGDDHTCALLSDGMLRCWGDNTYGQLGMGDKDSRPAAQPVVGLTGVASITTGWKNSCALLLDGTVYCWGKELTGLLLSINSINTNLDTNHILIPTQIPLVSNIQSLAIGDQHTCAILTGGTVSCWGRDSRVVGENGNVSLPSSAQAIAAGSVHTCAVLLDGKVYCWGWGIEGQLGDGIEHKSGFVAPVQVVGLSNATAITAHIYNTCAVDTRGEVYCWGKDGIGTKDQQSSAFHLTWPSESGVGQCP